MMLKLRRYMEDLMGIEPVAAGEDTRWHLRFNIGWPDWVLLLFFLFAVGFVLWIYLREGSTASRGLKLFLASLRLLVIVLVVLMLCGLEISIDRTGLPYLVLMVDDSESMGIRDQAPEELSGANASAEPAKAPTRLEKVTAWMHKDEGKSLQDLTTRHKLQVYAHSSAPRLLGTVIKPEETKELFQQIDQVEPVGRESRIGSNLRSVLNTLRGTPPSSVVLITDGVTTQGESLIQAAQYAARKNIPVFTIGVGNPDKIRDLELHDLLVDDTVFVDDTVTFEATLTGQGFEGQEVTISLKPKGEDTPLDERTFKVGADGQPVKVRLTHRPRLPGTIVYSLETPARPEEPQKENNKIERAVRVIKEKIRVLYVESYPRYEFRYLKNLLEREPTVELSVVLLDADPEYVQQDKAAVGYFPTNKQDLYEYDVLIFGDVAPSFFSQAQLTNVRDFVRVKGGGFLLIAGSHFAPQAYRDTILESLLPIEIGPASNRNSAISLTEGFVPRLTIEGQTSPMFRFVDDEAENDAIWASFPPMYWYAKVEKAKPGAKVLAEHPTDQKDGRAVPLVATQFDGVGRTYYQGFDGAWRWRYRIGDVYHSRYWIQTVRFLSRSKLLGKNRSVELTVDRRKYRRGDPAHLRVRFLDETLAPKGQEGVTLHIEREGHGERPLELKPLPNHPHIYEGVFAQTEDGSYRVRLTSPLVEESPPTAEFTVTPPPGELDRVQMNEPELQEVAKLTGGMYFPLARADSLFDNLPPGRRVALHTDPPLPLWNTWPVLALFLSLLTLEWVVRKRKRML